jgi:N-methylhydantoinase A
LDYRGETVEPLALHDVRSAIALFKSEKIEAVAICFMNSFANPEDEERAAALVREELPGAYLTVSSELLPSIRFYDRVSTTVLNSYVGPKLSSYIDNLTSRLREISFGGVLLIMQSNGGVMSPEVAREKAALTLLSGPAAGPGAGLGYARTHGHNSCITVDMGGTSFDAALVRDGAPIVVTEGEINRYRIALPMLGIVTIGAGGGSIAWIDEGGLLRMGPQSAGAEPGPACYGKGGTLPTCTDADLVLGYLDPDFFAGGKIRLNRGAAARAITEQIVGPLGLSVEEAAAGMYRVINTNMAQGVREITIKRGYDPREFPMVVAGGAGPLHACMICQELEIPMFIVPRESSIFCAAGMLMSDLQHDFVRSFVSPLGSIDWRHLGATVNDMVEGGGSLLTAEKIPEERRRFTLSLDCRYVKQYHEVSFPIPMRAVEEADVDRIASTFHAEHNRMYGYSLEQEGTPIELINVRLRAIGITDKPAATEEEYAGEDPAPALKGQRTVFLTEAGERKIVPVFDGHRTRFGYRVSGPAIVEQVNTTLFLTSAFDCICDKTGSFAVYLKGREDLVGETLREIHACAK